VAIAGAVALAVCLTSYVRPVEAASEKVAGVVTLDDDGRANVPFAPGFLDTHFCVVGDGWDDVSVGFSAKGFTVFEGKPGQEIPWACVPEEKAWK
jgi:hypothetical protein